MQEEFSDLSHNQGGLFRGLFWGGGGGGIIPSKTLNYAGNFKFGTQVQAHVNSKNIPLSTQTLKNQYSKIPLLKAILWELC